jgi:molecular chaperone GrpE
MSTDEGNEDNSPGTESEEGGSPAGAESHAHGRKHGHAASAKESEAHDKYLRAIADLENFKKRAMREKEELRLFGAARILEDLLPVIDNLALGMAAARQPNADLKTLIGGIEMVGQQLKGALAAHGMKEINPLGQPFDPHQHEALSREASDTVPADHVLSVVRSGFLLNGRLLRPAAVVVSNGPASS